MKLTRQGDDAKRWAKMACPCGCGAFTYVGVVDGQAFLIKIPAGVSRTTLAAALLMFRKEICAQMAVINNVKSRAFYDNSQNSIKTIH